MTINKVSDADQTDWQGLVRQLWPDAEPDELNLPSSGETAFLVRDENQLAVGFINLSLRTDYVPGAEHLPIAYVEGLFVVPAYQHKGIGRMLIERAEAWAREQGCTELASDTEIDNTVS